MASDHVCAVACAGGTGNSYGCHEGWDRDQHRTLPGDMMWLVLAADAEGQRNKGEGQACGGDTDMAPVFLGGASPVLAGTLALLRALPVGCAGAMSSVPC